MKKFPGASPPGPPGKEQRKGREREGEGGERTEEKKVMEKEGLKKGKGNWEARR
jgi:hypothetical protein